VVVLCAISVVSVGFGSASALAAAGRGTIRAPKGLPKFYAVPDPLPSSKAGTLIKSEKLTAADSPGTNGTVYRVMYVSKNLQNKPVAVTGIVIVPNTPAPAGGYPVVTWGHGTNGMADECAASLEPNSDVPLTNQLLEKGWLVASSDYQGEGTPGVLPYIAGVIAARNTIDIVRAAHQLNPAHASTNYVGWGHSEGGQTAMYVLDIAKKYAPELHLKGVVAGAPPSQFNAIYVFLKTSPFKHYLLMAAGGLNAAYGDKLAPLDEVLKPAGIKLIPQLDKGCDLGTKFKDVTIDTVSKGDPFLVPEWKKLLEENDPQHLTKAGDSPLLIIHGGNDEQIPTATSGLLATHMCELGTQVSRWVYPGASHAGVIGPSSGDMIHWMTDRFDGGPTPDPYVPTGQSDIEVTSCPS
jgi:pimeloyl-ACP methyl ester carboxylesterase